MERDDLKKKILYLATHRGTKEADLVLGAFVHNILEDASAADLLFLASFLALPDDTLMQWLLRKHPLPQPFQHPLVEALQAFVDTKI